MRIELVAVIDPPRCPYCRTHRITSIPLRGGDTARRVVHHAACRVRWDPVAKRKAELKIDAQLDASGVPIAHYGAVPLQHKFLTMPR